MDKTSLVAGDREIEARVIAALSGAKIPVTAVEWNWVPQLDEWQLVIVTSLHDSKGPRETYARIFKALSAAGVYQSVPIRRLFVKGPEDPFAQELLRQLRFTTEGTIHIVRNTSSAKNTQYSVVFAPYVGTGGAIPAVRFREEDALRTFLEKRVVIPSYEVDRAINQLDQKGNASIFNVQLNLRRAKRLNLAA